MKDYDFTRIDWLRLKIHDMWGQPRRKTEEERRQVKMWEKELEGLMQSFRAWKEARHES